MGEGWGNGEGEVALCDRKTAIRSAGFASCACDGRPLELADLMWIRRDEAEIRWKPPNNSVERGQMIAKRAGVVKRVVRHLLFAAVLKPVSATSWNRRLGSGTISPGPVTSRLANWCDVLGPIGDDQWIGVADEEEGSASAAAGRDWRGFRSASGTMSRKRASTLRSTHCSSGPSCSTTT